MSGGPILGIDFMSPLSIDFYNFTYRGKESIDLKRFFSSVASRGASGGPKTVGNLTMTGATIGTGKFVGMKGVGAFTARWVSNANATVDVQTQDPRLYKNAIVVGTYAFGGSSSMQFPVRIFPFNTGSIRITVGLKNSFSKNIDSNRRAKNDATIITNHLVPQLISDAIDAMGISHRTTDFIRPLVEPSNVAASGSTRRAFRVDLYADAEVQRLARDLNGQRGFRWTVYESPNPWSAKNPPAFLVRKPMAEADVGKLLAWSAPPRVRVGGDGLTEFFAVRFTAQGAKTFARVVKKMRDPKLAGFTGVNALVDFRNGDVDFVTSRGGYPVETYRGVFKPEKIANVYLWHTGSVTITGASDILAMYQVYYGLETIFAVDEHRLFSTGAQVRNRAAPQERGVNRPKALAPERPGRKDGTTCKPASRIPRPNAFGGVCPPGFHVRPNAKKFPCCFKNGKDPREAIVKAYAKAKIAVPPSVVAAFPGLVPSNGPVRNNNKTMPKIDLDKRGRLRIDGKQCAAQPISVLERAAQSLDIPPAVANDKNGRRVVKRTKADLCATIQGVLMPSMVTKDGTNNNKVLRLQGKPCDEYDESFLVTYLEGMRIAVPTNVRNVKKWACEAIDIIRDSLQPFENKNAVEGYEPMYQMLDERLVATPGNAARLAEEIANTRHRANLNVNWSTTERKHELLNRFFGFV